MIRDAAQYSISPVWRTAAKTAVGTFLPCQPRRAMSGFRVVDDHLLLIEESYCEIVGNCSRIYSEL